MVMIFCEETSSLSATSKCVRLHFLRSPTLVSFFKSIFWPSIAFAGAIKAFALIVFGKRGRTGVLAPSQRPSEHAL